jgi:GNAT superfamily N-acetyltransferase
MNIIFELAKPEDAEKLYEIQKLAYKEQLEIYKDYDTNPAVEGIGWVQFKIKHHIYYKIICDGKIIGEVDVYQHKRSSTHYEMNGVFVHPDYQNKGIGEKAIQFVEEEFKDAVVWTTWTPHKMDKNHYFYEKVGYKRTGIEEKIFDNLILVQYGKRLN